MVLGCERRRLADMLTKIASKRWQTHLKKVQAEEEVGIAQEKIKSADEQIKRGGTG